MALWPSWAADVLNLGEDMVKTRRRASRCRIEMALHETQSETQCRHWLTFRIIGSTVWSRGGRNQVRALPRQRRSQMKSFECCSAEECFFSFCYVYEWLPWSIPPCRCSHPLLSPLLGRCRCCLDMPCGNELLYEMEGCTLPLEKERARITAPRRTEIAIYPQKENVILGAKGSCNVFLLQ